MNHYNKNVNTDIRQIHIDIMLNLISLIIALGFCRALGSAESILPMSVIGALFILIFILINKVEYLYNVTLFFYKDRIFRKITKSYVISGAVSFFVLAFTRIPVEDWMWFGLFLLLDGMAFFSKVIFMKPGYENGSSDNVPRVLYVGKIERFDRFCRYIRMTNIRQNVVGYVAMNEKYFREKEGYIGWLGDLEEIIRTNHVDQVYIMQRHGSQVEFSQTYVDMCITMGVTVKLIMDLYDAGSAHSYVSSVGTYPVITYHRISLNVSDQNIKRLVDIVLSSIGIVVFSPLMLIIAIAVKLSSPGPVLFRQTRVGQNGRHFKMLKFRSMYADAEEHKQELMDRNEMTGDVMFKIKDDPRITKVGRFIRKTSLDELPQLFNIFTGQMSLVGTRPPTLDEVEKYKTDQWRRISIKPGLTGMWQVMGRSNVLDFDEIVRLDTEYIDKWSLWLDFKILLKTVPVVLKHEGSY